MKYLITFVFSWVCLGHIQAQRLSKKEKAQIEQDKAIIKQMVGCFKVTFEFAETFSPNNEYSYKDRKFDEGIETVFIVEETPNKLSLQHILVVNDTIIIKHWRQDWIYQNRDFLVYEGNNTFSKINRSAKDVKGTWTQKVYQVDDSPRYEAMGIWVHVDGRHFWQGSTDAPLPRREFTTRNDYNILRRHSTMKLTSFGWILEQDNEKINRTNKGDELIVWEKGFEKFIRGDYNCKPAYAWWNQQQQYWSIVREIWSEVFDQREQFDFNKGEDGKPLFTELFAKGDELSTQKNMSDEQIKKEVRLIINNYLNKNQNQAGI